MDPLKSVWYATTWNKAMMTTDSQNVHAANHIARRRVSADSTAVRCFQQRAERIEAQLPHWGQGLYHATLAAQPAQEALYAWQRAAAGAERRFSVLVDSDLPDGSSSEAQATAKEAATALLSLPWELLHDGHSHLFQGRNAVRVRRRLPNRRPEPRAVTALPIRILLVSPRPENARTGYIDHRISALPLVEYDRTHGLGGLCFEDPQDSQKLHERGMTFVDARDMAAVVREYRIPLVFLEACQSARAEVDPTASVVARLREEGVTSVVAMSHSVLVETARRFVQAFYAELARGARVSQAMLAGQQALYINTYRDKIMRAGDLHLRNWFVPVLYQEEHDPQLFTALWPDAMRQLQAQPRRLSLGALSTPPPHHFQGRSRELLALERLLHDHPYTVVRGPGSMGKTTLAVELAHWLVRTGRFRRAAFVSLETVSDVRSVLDSLGQQVLPEGANWSVAQYPDLRQAWQPVQRALAAHPTIIVLDNMESVLPDATGHTPAAAAPVEELFALCQDLLNADPATRLLFTSYEALPAPFAQRRNDIGLGALSRDDAIALVSQVMAQEGVRPHPSDPGSTPQEITDLVEAVNRHPRALVVLAREVARRGVRTTTNTVRELMAALHDKYPDDRQQSLYASVELSLRRLTPDVRMQLQPLAVFQGGVNLIVWAHLLGTDAETVSNLARALIDVGLGEYMAHGHLRLDPALPPYVLQDLSQAEQERLRARWAEGMGQLVVFLYEQLFQDASLATRLTLLELPNLLTLLAWIQDKEAPEKVIAVVSRGETLIARLGYPHALAQATAVREQAAQSLGEWSHARYLADSGNIDRLLERGKLQAAHTAAQHLLERCLAAGEAAYQEAVYDIALAHFKLGRALLCLGAAESALQPLTEAQQRFQALSQTLADAGATDAEHMVSVAICEYGDCLKGLGRLDEAATAYEDAIRRAESLDAKRQIAVSKGQLGTVRWLQRRYDEALEAYVAARETFETLGEPGSVAIAWHQIGMVHTDTGQLKQAEQAYRQSLAIKVQQKDRAGEADSLGALGVLYARMGRLEEAVTFFRQVADICFTLRNLIGEGKARSALANTLIKLHRYDELRQELYRAVKCYNPFGHAAEPWKTWTLLHDLEQATGNSQAAADAWQQAVQSYLAYRRDGGESQEPSARLCTQIAHGIQQGEMNEAAQFLAQAAVATDTPAWLKIMVPKLQAILNDDRDPSLATDPALDYRDAAELLLLLETLGET